EPDAALPAALTVGIVPRHRLEGRDLLDPDFARAPVGNGAFRLAEWRLDGRLTFAADPAYYFVPGARVAQIVWQRFGDDGALLSAIERGEVAAAEVDGAAAARLKAERGWQVREMQGGVR